ncbi:MAG: diadenylate cyclase CdaA [Clostridia bacterium]|nr:diadenylate cyclase CdaA [Clostridia bacterium]
MTIQLFGLSPIYVQWNDLLDILIVAFVVYKAIKLFKETRAIQLLKGVALLVAAFFVSGWLELRSLNFILRNTLEIGLFALIVLFQPELKRALERLGGRRLRKFFGFRSSGEDADIKTLNMIDSICEAVGYFKETKTGALIVIERTTPIGDIIATGTSIDADISARLLENIFFKGAALHDGAAVIRDNKLCAAGCLLPLSQNMTISAELGTRHRAAIGMSENSDAVVIIVSEETGYISVALGGGLQKNLSKDQLNSKLRTILLQNTGERGRFFRSQKGGKQ